MTESKTPSESVIEGLTTRHATWMTAIPAMLAGARRIEELESALAASRDAREKAEALVHQHRSEFLGEIQGRVIELGGDPPDWPARNDIEAHDDVESAARMILELLQERDALAAKLAEAERLQLKQSTPPIVRYTLDISDGRMVKSPDGFWASADELAAAYTTIATLTSKLAEAESGSRVAAVEEINSMLESVMYPPPPYEVKVQEDYFSGATAYRNSLKAAIDAAISQERSDEH